MANIQIHGLVDKVKFGRHAGKDLLIIIEEDPAWVRWAVENVSYFDIDQEAEEALIETEADAEIEAEDFADWSM